MIEEKTEVHNLKTIAADLRRLAPSRPEPIIVWNLIHQIGNFIKAAPAQRRALRPLILLSVNV